MRHVLRDLPFRDTASDIEVGEQRVLVRPYQIVVWVSVSAGESPKGPPFPAVLDTGHTHNFSIQETLLTDWAQLHISDLESLGDILVNQRLVPLRKAHLWIHRNRPGTPILLPLPVPLDVVQGIAVYPRGTPGAPRLPLLGLRVLVRNHLKLTIDGDRMTVSLQAPTHSSR